MVICDKFARPFFFLLAVTLFFFHGNSDCVSWATMSSFPPFPALGFLVCVLQTSDDVFFGRFVRNNAQPLDRALIVSLFLLFFFFAFMRVCVIDV